MSAEELFASMPESVALMERTEELDKTLAAARSEIEKKETLIETLLPWERLDARIEDIHATRSVRYARGLFALCAVEQVEAAGFAVEAFPGARETAVLVASAASEYDAMQRALKELDFAEFNFPAMKGTPRMNIRALETEIASLRETEAQTVNALETVAKQRTLLSRAWMQPPLNVIARALRQRLKKPPRIYSRRLGACGRGRESAEGCRRRRQRCSALKRASRLRRKRRLPQ